MKYDLATKNNSDGFTPRAYAAVTEYNGKMYVMGGYSQTENALLDIIEVYDPDGNDGSGSWSTLTQTLPMPVALAKAVTLNDKIYICGGTTNGGNAEKTLYESTAKNHHVDFAIRYSQSIGNWDNIRSPLKVFIEF